MLDFVLLHQSRAMNEEMWEEICNLKRQILRLQTNEENNKADIELLKSMVYFENDYRYDRFGSDLSVFTRSLSIFKENIHLKN